MSQAVTAATLDEILALQLTVAWAGEGACTPPRLNWWRTDLIDPAGGGDLLARLLPRTHAWAALEAVREAAIRVDARARAQMPDPDQIRTLFFLGFELDERLAERLAHHKRSGALPDQALPLTVDLAAPFSADQVAQALRSSTDRVDHTVVPGGRQVKGAMPDSASLLTRHLAAALVPLAGQYPMPFYGLR